MSVRLLDTNIVSFMVKAHPLGVTYRPHLVGYTLAVSFQTVAELNEWAARASWGPTRRASLAYTVSQFVVYHSDDVTCARWAEIRAARRTQPIAVDDAWIAATALAHGLELVTHNPADFRGIPGLSVVTEAP